MRKKNIITGSLYLFFSILACNIPLLNYLGYEFSLFIAFLSFLFAGSYTIKYLKHSITENTSEPEFFSSIKKLYCTNLLFLLIPFCAGLINSIFVRNCSYFTGISFFILLPVISVIFSVSLSIFIFMIFEKWKRLIFYLIFFAFIVFSLHIIFFNPQLFIYNPIFGYFPGIIYDEELFISLSLILYRALNMLGAVFFLFAGISIFISRKPRKKFIEKVILIKDAFLKYKFLFAILFIQIVFILFQNELQIIIDKFYIQEQLGSHYYTKRFNIFYSSKSFNNEDIERIAQSHELYLSEIEKQLGIKYPYIIESYIYPTSEFKRDLVGAKYTNFAKPWLNQIHINGPTWDDVLKHELVHVVSGYFGLPVIKASFLPGLVEGLAMAIDNENNSRTLDELAALLLKINRFINMDELMGFAGFSSKHPSFSYILSGSFSKFLINKYGIEKYKPLYPEGKFEKYYNKNITELNNEWKEYLKTISINPHDTILVKYVFGRKTLFQKVCSRVIANLNESANNEYKNKNYAKSEILHKESLSLSYSSESLSGLILAFFQQKKYDSVLAYTNKVFINEETKYSFLPLRLQRGDAFWYKSITESQPEFIDSAIANYSILRDLHLSESYDLALNSRLSSVQYSSISDKMLEYFVSKKDDFLRAIILKDLNNEHPGFYTANILLAEMLMNKKEYTESIKYLNSIPENLQDDFIKKEKYRFLGMNEFYRKNYSLALDIFKRAEEIEKNLAYKYRIEEWIDKCRYAIGMN